MPGFRCSLEVVKCLFSLGSGLGCSVNILDYLGVLLRIGSSSGKVQFQGRVLGGSTAPKP